MTNSIYSLFGDKEKGYKRFLYDPYLPRAQNAEACIFGLTAKDMKYYFDIAWDLTNAACEALVSALGDGHRVWPVDRFLITSMIHAMLYGDALGKAFLYQHGNEISSFIAMHHSPDVTTMRSVALPMRSIDPGLIERSLCAVLQANNIPVAYEVSQDAPLIVASPYNTVKSLLKGIKCRYRKALWERNLRSIRKKPLLISCNSFIDEADTQKLSEAVDILSLDTWARGIDWQLSRRVGQLSTQQLGWKNRSLWKDYLIDVAGRCGLGILHRLFPLMAEMHPASLLEERTFLIKEARRLVHSVRTRVENCRVAFCLDQGLWRLEWAGALAQALLEKNYFVVGKNHGPTGHGRCNFPDLIEQNLRTHFASFTKRPFVRCMDDSLKILPVKFPKKLCAHSLDQVKSKEKYSVWFFPHNMSNNPGDGLHYFFTDHVWAEYYYERTTSILEAMTRVARHPKVQEIVIKPKPDRTPQVEKHRSFLAQQIAQVNHFGKIRLADPGLTTPEALPFVSIAVHDMLSTPAFQTLFHGIPSIIFLGEQEELPEDLTEDDRWVSLGVFVKDANQLEPVLSRWINCDFKLPADLSQKFKADWCGNQSPTIEEQLTNLLTSDPKTG